MTKRLRKINSQVMWLADNEGVTDPNLCNRLRKSASRRPASQRRPSESQWEILKLQVAGAGAARTLRAAVAVKAHPCLYLTVVCEDKGWRPSVKRSAEALRAGGPVVAVARINRSACDAHLFGLARSASRKCRL